MPDTLTVCGWPVAFDDTVNSAVRVPEAAGVKIIDSEQEVHGYPSWEPTQRAFDPAKWDMETLRPLDPAVLDSGAKAKGT